MMTTLGPMLCLALARNISGQASRSELDRLSDPVKKLASHYPQAKQWLETAITDPSLSESSLKLETKLMLVKKVIR
jgi:hypothetical protein